MESASRELSKLTLHNPPAEAPEPPPRTLKIKQKKNGKNNSTPQFSDRQRVGSFGIGKNLEYRTDLRPRVLIPEHSFQNIVGRQLRDIKDQLIWVENDLKYKQLKQDYFLKCLEENEFMAKVAEGVFPKPDFIFLNDIMKPTLLSPYEGEGHNPILPWEWRFYGMRYNDMIFIWEDANRDKKPVNDKRNRRNRLHGMAFLHLATCEQAESQLLNRSVQNFEVQEIKFGSHQLLCFHEKEAVDDKGNWVEIKVSYNGLERQDTKMFCWAEDVAAGIKKYVVGKHTDGWVKNVTTKTFKDITDPGIKLHWKKEECLAFQDRLFNWIKDQLAENDKGVIKEFHRDRNSNSVAVRDVSGTTFPFDFEHDCQLPVAFYGSDRANSVGRWIRCDQQESLPMAVTLRSGPTLKIADKRPFTYPGSLKPLGSPPPRFSLRQTLGTFGTDAELGYRVNPPPRVLIPKASFQSLVGLKLEKFKANLQNTWVEKDEDYVKYKQLKTDYFLNFLKEKGLIPMVGDGDGEVIFICLNDIVKKTIMSPYSDEVTRPVPDWKFYGMRFDNMIFLWKGKNKKKKQKKSKNPKNNRNRLNGMGFLHLATSNDPEMEIFDRNVRTFEVQKISIGTHQLLSFHEKEAVDEEGNWVEVKVSYNGLTERVARLQAWSQHLAPGIEKFLVGTHNYGEVTDVQVKTFEDITGDISQDMRKECLAFEDSLFSWIKDELKENDTGVIKKFYRDLNINTNSVGVRDAPGVKVPFDINKLVGGRGKD